MRVEQTFVYKKIRNGEKPNGIVVEKKQKKNFY